MSALDSFDTGDDHATPAPLTAQDEIYAEEWDRLNAEMERSNAA